MKSLAEIKKEVKKGDCTRVAEIIGRSYSLVERVIAAERTDHYGIQKIMSDMLELREKHQDRADRQRKKLKKNLL